MKDLLDIIGTDTDTIYTPETNGIEGIDIEFDDREFGFIGEDEDMADLEELQEMYG